MRMESSLQDHRLFIIANHQGLIGTVITETALHNREITRTGHHSKETTKHTAHSKMAEAMPHSRIMCRLDKMVEVMDHLVDSRVKHPHTKGMEIQLVRVKIITTHRSAGEEISGLVALHHLEPMASHRLLVTTGNHLPRHILAATNGLLVLILIMVETTDRGQDQNMVEITGKGVLVSTPAEMKDREIGRYESICYTIFTCDVLLFRLKI
jgi:hypothetical protein